MCIAFFPSAPEVCVGREREGATRLPPGTERRWKDTSFYEGMKYPNTSMRVLLQHSGSY